MIRCAFIDTHRMSRLIILEDRMVSILLYRRPSNESIDCIGSSKGIDILVSMPIECVERAPTIPTSTRVAARAGVLRARPAA